ncbi:lipopolysaccharide biosynthesis protein [Nesterenkonia sp. AY15]|uniref:lipopolysaccharide biosynthesis protein n=1 Tax=Nesterenkonia sp. AY15 TaxID=2901139 RepID=UPI001F4D2EE1|nr:hypothetical protein [Nesterenkonia sp. AY15]
MTEETVHAASVNPGPPRPGPHRSWTAMFARTAGLRIAVLPISALCALTTAGLTVHYAGVLAFGFITLVAQLQLALPFADLGMGAAVARAVARVDGSARAAEEVRTLIRRTALLLLAVGLLGATAAALSGVYGFWSRVFEVPETLAPQVDLVMSLVLGVFFLSLPLGIAERVLVGRDRSDVLVLLGLLPSVGNVLVVYALGQLGVPVAWLALGLPLSTLGFLGVCGYLAFLHPRIGIRTILIPERSANENPVDGCPVPAEHDERREEIAEGTSIRLILLGGLPVLLATAGMVLSEQHGRLVLASAATALDLSEYAIALQLYMPIYSVLYMAATVLWPRFAVDPSPQLWRRANLLLTGLGACAALGFIIFARPVAGLVTGGALVPSWGVVLGLGAALVAQAAHLTQTNLFTDRRGFWRQAAMSLVLLILVVPGTLFGIQLGLGPAAPGVSMALGVTLAQVIPGLLMASRLVRHPRTEAPAAPPATDPAPAPMPAVQAAPLER